MPLDFSQGAPLFQGRNLLNSMYAQQQPQPGQGQLPNLLGRVLAQKGVSTGTYGGLGGYGGGAGAYSLTSQGPSFAAGASPSLFGGGAAGSSPSYFGNSLGGGAAGSGGMGAAGTAGVAAGGVLAYDQAIKQSGKWAGDVGKWMTTANPIWGTQISALIGLFK